MVNKAGVRDSTHNGVVTTHPLSSQKFKNSVAWSVKGFRLSTAIQSRVHYDAGIHKNSRVARHAQCRWSIAACSLTRHSAEVSMTAVLLHICAMLSCNKTWLPVAYSFLCFSALLDEPWEWIATRPHEMMTRCEIVSSFKPTESSV